MLTGVSLVTTGRRNGGRSPTAGTFRIDAPSIQLLATPDTNQGRRTAVFGVRNTGTQTLQVTMSLKYNSPWLSVTPTSAPVASGQSIEVRVQLQAGGFPGGIVQRDAVVVTAAGVSEEVPITVTVVSSANGTPLLSGERGITLFYQPNGQMDEQTIILSNAGPGNLDWAASEDLGLVDVRPSFKGVLSPGGYQPLLVQTTTRASLPDAKSQTSLNFRYAGNAEPQVVIANLERVSGPLPPRANFGGVILGLPNQGPETIKITYTSLNDQRIIISAPAWIDVTYPGAPQVPVLRGGNGFELTLRLVDPGKVKIGERGTIILSFPGLVINQREHTIAIEVVAGGILPTTAAATETRSAAVSCAPTMLTAVFLNPVNLFNVRARLPVPIQARILDDCGTPLRSGAASVFFSSGEPAVALSYWPDEIWRGTWQPINLADSQISLKLSAVSAENLTRAQSFIYGFVSQNNVGPVVKAGSVRNAASARASGDTLAGGTIVSIFGDQLATSEAPYSARPTKTLARTSVRIGSKYLPLFYVSPTQVNAVVPFAIPLGPAQLIVERDDLVSVPLPIVVAAAQPGIFSVNELGTGQGSIRNQKGLLADSQAPAQRGEIVQIFCTGLGNVTPSVEVDEPAPDREPVPRITGTITAIVGTSSAEVLFAGLAPGSNGIYRVDLRVPQAVNPGPEVPVRLSIDGLDSNTVTMAVQ